MNTGNPRATGEDLTAKARIRNAAMDLYAQQGEDRTSMRAIADAAGVTVGLLVHHYGTKDRIRDAVEQLVVDHFAAAIAAAPDAGDPRAVARARNESVARMLGEHPEVVNYLRRALLEPADRRGFLLERLTELTRSEIVTLRASGMASVSRSESAQVVDVLVDQLGRLFLQPLVDASWAYLVGDDATAARVPGLAVRVDWGAGAGN